MVCWKKFGPLVLGCVLRTAGSSIIDLVDGITCTEQPYACRCVDNRLRQPVRRGTRAHAVQPKPSKVCRIQPRPHAVQPKPSQVCRIQPRALAVQPKPSLSDPTSRSRSPTLTKSSLSDQTFREFCRSGIKGPKKGHMEKEKLENFQVSPRSFIKILIINVLIQCCLIRFRLFFASLIN